MFSPDRESVLRAAAALVNTQAGASPSGTDELTRIEDVERFFGGWAYTGLLEHTSDELERVRRLRTELRAYFTETRDEVAQQVNAALASARALPQLIRHDGFDWHLHAVPFDAPFDQRIRVETAMTMSDLVRVDEVDRVKECAADDCTAVFVDLSRNRSKRFCDDKNCGNRANVTAYRARRAAGTT